MLAQIEPWCHREDLIVTMQILSKKLGKVKVEFLQLPWVSLLKMFNVYRLYAKIVNKMINLRKVFMDNITKGGLIPMPAWC